MNLQGLKRKVVYVGLDEAIAFVCGTLGFVGAFDAGVERAGALPVFASIFAVTWNFLYNALFERWESGRAEKGRTWRGAWRMRSALKWAFWWC